MLQVVECQQCGFVALAVYTEKRHSALDTIDWKHIGYRVAEPDLAAVRHLIRECPQPLDAYCTCPSHTYLSRLDTRGCWQGLVEFEIQGDFTMRMLL